MTSGGIGMRTGCALAVMLAGISACERPPTPKSEQSTERAAINAVRPDTPAAAPIRAKFAARTAREPLLRGAEIRLTVLPGRVRLSGFVYTAGGKLRAAELARDLAGTAIVENRLVVRNAPEVAQRSPADAPIYL